MLPDAPQVRLRAAEGRTCSGEGLPGGSALLATRADAPHSSSGAKAGQSRRAEMVAQIANLDTPGTSRRAADNPRVARLPGYPVVARLSENAEGAAIRLGWLFGGPVAELSDRFAGFRRCRRS